MFLSLSKSNFSIVNSFIFKNFIKYTESNNTGINLVYLVILLKMVKVRSEKKRYAVAVRSGRSGRYIYKKSISRPAH